NVDGEPIVCSPLDAIRCFFGSGIDDLAIGPFLVSKRQPAPWSSPEPVSAQDVATR
ncbi:MAG: hypothetical protein HYW10_04515, partial [Candidatus Omnitrophica bacterium]|nr:hypothetical protein [Candidatus Omnitrophota bacterium]